MARSQLILEFIGLPGSGKSTLAASLASRLSGEFEVDLPSRADYRLKELTRLEKLRLDLEYVPTFIGYRLQRLLYDATNSRFGWWVLTNSWNRSRFPLLLIDRARRSPVRIHVLDEWLLHRTIGESISRYKASIEFSKKFAFPPSMRQRLIYICVNVDQRTACSRAVAQDQPFRRFAKDKDLLHIESVLALWYRQLEELKPDIERLGHVLINVDGHAPVESTVHLLQERLRLLAGECS